MVEIGDVLGFCQVSFGIFGLGNQPAVGHFDGNRAVQLVVMSQIDPPEATLAQDTYHSVAANLRWHLNGRRIR